MAGPRGTSGASSAVADAVRRSGLELDSGSIVGLETLVRGSFTELGNIGATELISVAEETGSAISCCDGVAAVAMGSWAHSARRIGRCAVPMLGVKRFAARRNAVAVRFHDMARRAARAPMLRSAAEFPLAVS